MSDNTYPTIPAISSLLDAFASPAILMDRNYVIRAANRAYREAYSGSTALLGRHCYEVSHGYEAPCDRAGEDCPLQGCLRTNQRQRVLHIHNTPNGKEHIDVELTPVHNSAGEIEYFVEIMHQVHAPDRFEKNRMVGFSPAFNQMLELLSRAAPSDISVLLLGESGTGKELAAQYLHEHSDRAKRPFVTVECSGLSESLFESELFGHEKGAFTGASQRKQGLVSSAEGGTLFLDEVGDIPLPMQVKLLRLIETGTYRPVGSVTERKANFRLICATHRNLLEMVAEGRFRQDLYYRISPFPILLPSLHERRQDIVPIAERILKQLKYDRPIQLSDSARRWLAQQHFAGNIRELRNRIERAILLCDSDRIEPQHLQLPAILSSTGHSAIPLETPLNAAEASMQNDIEDMTDAFAEAFADLPAVPLEQLEMHYLNGLLESYNGDNAELAAALNISERTLYRKLAKAKQPRD